MKKIVLTLAAMMTMSMAFANTENIPENAPEVTEASTAANYDMTVNYSKLATTLELSADQIDAVEAIHDQFINDMRKAANAEASERAEPRQEGCHQGAEVHALCSQREAVSQVQHTAQPHS